MPSANLKAMLYGTKILPILSDPTSVDGDGDGYDDFDEDNWDWNGIDKRYETVNPLKSNTIQTFFPELYPCKGKNKTSNAVFIKIDGNHITYVVNYKLSGIANEQNIYYNSSDEAAKDIAGEKTNFDVAKKSIMDVWCGEFKGNLYDFYPGLNITVDIEFREAGFGDSYVEFYITDDIDECNMHSSQRWGFDGCSWKRNISRKMTLVTKYSDRGVIMDLAADARYQSPAHEFGHSLGLGDIYGDSETDYKSFQPVVIDINNLKSNEIWYSSHGDPNTGAIMKSGPAQALCNDIEMTLYAVIKNEQQCYRKEKSIAVSQAIKLRPLAFLNVADNKFYSYSFVDNKYALIGGTGLALDFKGWLFEYHDIWLPNEDVIKKFYGIEELT